MSIRPILYVIGIFLSILATSMVIPLLVDLAHGHEDWKVFLFSMVITGFCGGVLILINRTKKFQLNVKQTFLLTTLSWLSLCLFASIPFGLAEVNMSVTDSVFEAASGLTTTGSTVMTNLENTPPGILMWRALLQWLGGVGIIVMALSVLPILKVGGMQLFKTESSENEKALPRATQIAATIAFIYLGLTILCMLGYQASGLGSFDSWAHAMTTIATGGFSTFDSSFSAFDTAWSEINAIIFMILGGLPFILYIKAIGGNFKPLFVDAQVRTFLKIITFSIFIMLTYLVLHNGTDFFEALRRASFNVVSVITGTGYTNGNYAAWGGFAVSMIFFLMLIGGCAGSTTCGIKVFRFMVLYEVAISQLKKLIYPHGVFVPHYNQKALPNGVASSVTSFFFIYLLCLAVLAMALSFVGLDFLTAMSGAVTSISNVGPGLGNIIGPDGTFEPLPDAAKWIMCVGMFLGRLELFTVLVLLLPHFWRK
ncbi:MAG: TrkH family potassium uptake protein [Pseudomonadota bacterium]